MISWTPQLDELVARLHAARTNIHDKFFSAFNEDDASLDPDKMRKEISAMLIQERRQLAYTLMGIDTSWGRLELKNSNDPKLPLASHMREMASKAVADFFSANPDYCASELANVINTPPMKKAMREEYRRVYESYFRSHLQKLAKDAATAEAERAHKRIMDALSLKSPTPPAP